MPRHPRYPSLVGPLALLLTLTVCGFSHSQGPDPEDLSPGLVLTARSGGTVVRSIAPDLSLDWGTESPDPRLDRDGFHFEATGYLLIQQVGDHRFLVESDGEVRLELDGQAISPGVPVHPSPGPRRLTLRYRHAKGDARVKLTWEGPGFGREARSRPIVPPRRRGRREPYEWRCLRERPAARRSVGVRQLPRAAEPPHAPVHRGRRLRKRSPRSTRRGSCGSSRPARRRTLDSLQTWRPRWSLS